MKAYYLSILFLILCLQVNGQKKPVSQQQLKVLSLIGTLPEVVENDKYVRSKTKGARYLETYIEREPTKADRYYYLAVAENNGMCMVSHFKFAVDAKTYAISYYDVIADKRIPLSYWRKHGRKRM
jgi:hypothetical protein